MVRRLPFLAGLVLLAVPAQAEDFTGFYAGVNAGYGWSRDRDHGTPPAATPGTPTNAFPATVLPPSATAAAASLRRQDRGTANR